MQWLDVGFHRDQAQIDVIESVKGKYFGYLMRFVEVCAVDHA